MGTLTEQATTTEKMKAVHLIIERQDNPNAKPYTEEFEVEYRPGMNVIACLMAIRANPVTKSGKPVAPVKIRDVAVFPVPC